MAADPHAKADIEVDAGHWKSPWSESAQAEWIDLYVPLLMAKQSIVGIFWSHFSDAVPHVFPHAGLLRPEGTAKPALDPFVKYRRAHWQSDDEDMPI